GGDGPCPCGALQPPLQHWSLQRGEPDLRHLVLVANTLRRVQDEMELASLSVRQQGLCVEAWLDDSGSLPGPGQGPCWEPPVLPPSLSPVDQLPASLQHGMCLSVFSILGRTPKTSGKGFGDPLWPAMVQAADSLLGKPSPESGQTAPPCLAPLELMGPGQTLLQESLDGIFSEDI
ncbi:SERTA domain-containing protein 1, partial [Sphaerodactylus townsendi]|uniref:SERTA domain-containing protein 1 n=1 Tax=Sphaerodactylus townsendi TaxID=933632 RepID=UPI0020273DEB